MTKDEWNNYVIDNGIQTEFGVNEWGSYQYDGALQFYELFFKIRKDLSLEDTLEVLESRFEFTKINSIDDVKKQLIKDSIERIYEDLEDDFYGVKFEAERLQRIAEAGTADYLFDALRKSAHDLWSAAPYIANLFFENLQISTIKAPGQGPIFNKEIQSYNFETGLYCAMLKEKEIISDPTFAYSGFDT